MNSRPIIAIIGAGPAGLMAAETLAPYALVTVYDHMPSVARKFLMAGRGGLNLTHGEPLKSFLTRYGSAASWLQPSLEAFPPSALRTWCEGLGEETFVGTSGRVFPKSLKASPLLRAWLRRMDGAGVKFMLRHRWKGWNEAGDLLFEAGKEKDVKADATILALGGASWPRLGSDAAWVELLDKAGIEVTSFRPSNCGFIAPWSDFFASRFAGEPLKPVTLSFNSSVIQGEVMITARGVEGGAVYALSASLREAIEKKGEAILKLDLKPGLSLTDLAQRLRTPRGSQSFSNYLRKATGLSQAAIALLREMPHGPNIPENPEALANLMKALPIKLTDTAPIDRAISSAGGIPHSEFNDDLMLKKKPGVFAAGEMLDWEAPTGGYLLQASFSTAVRAAKGVKSYLNLTN